MKCVRKKLLNIYSKKFILSLTNQIAQDARAILNKAAGHIDSRRIDIEKSDETMAEEDSDEKKLSTSTDSEKSNTLGLKKLL